jgi:hypothetical protein
MHFLAHTKQLNLQILQMYPNRYAKIDFYGQENPDIDPVPKMEKIVNLAASMTDRELHGNISKVFLSQRDKHLVYKFPGKQSCFAFSLGFNLRPIVESNRLEVIIRRGIDHDVQSLGIEEGDTVLKVDGLRPKEYYEKHKWLTMGANEDGGFRSAMEHIHLRYGPVHEPPNKDSTLLDMLSFRKKTPYKISVPWKVLQKDECLKRYDAIVSNSTQDAIATRDPSMAQMNGTNVPHPARNLSYESNESYFGAPWKKLRIHGKDE